MIFKVGDKVVDKETGLKGKVVKVSTQPFRYWEVDIKGEIHEYHTGELKLYKTTRRKTKNDNKKT